MFTIAFYNLENFFDTIDDPNTDDDDFTPRGIMHWFYKRYRNKHRKIAKTILRIGKRETRKPPVLIGLAEVENDTVLADLTKELQRRGYTYRYVHYESADRRGMDTALLYNPDFFRISYSKPYPVELRNNADEPYFTRDILYCRGELTGEPVHIFVNHWPSQREGYLESEHKRKKAAERLKEQIDFLRYTEPEANIIIMGDFNTNPDDIIFREMFKGFTNFALQAFRNGKASLYHDEQKMLFDQIIVSNSLIEHSPFLFHGFKVFNPRFLRTWKRHLSFLPFRTYLKLKYQNGYSDHFPVYCIFDKNQVL